MTIGSVAKHTPAAISSAKLNVAREAPRSEGVSSPSSTKVTSAETAKASGGGGLLAPSSFTALLDITAGPAVDMNGLTKAPSARDWINQAVKKSQAEYASGKVEKATSGQVGPASLTDAYKQSDVETFKAMTGWNLVVLNGATMILDDDGNPPPPDSPLTDRLVDLSGAIGSDRQDGKLTGDITPEYLNDIFDRFANVEREFSSDWLDKAFNYLEGDSDRKVASS